MSAAEDARVDRITDERAHAQSDASLGPPLEWLQKASRCDRHDAIARNVRNGCIFETHQRPITCVCGPGSMLADQRPDFSARDDHRHAVWDTSLFAGTLSQRPRTSILGAGSRSLRSGTGVHRRSGEGLNSTSSAAAVGEQRSRRHRSSSKGGASITIACVVPIPRWATGRPLRRSWHGRPRQLLRASADHGVVFTAKLTSEVDHSVQAAHTGIEPFLRTLNHLSKLVAAVLLEGDLTAIGGGRKPPSTD